MAPQTTCDKKERGSCSWRDFFYIRWTLSLVAGTITTDEWRQLTAYLPYTTLLIIKEMHIVAMISTLIGKFHKQLNIMEIVFEHLLLVSDLIRKLINWTQYRVLSQLDTTRYAVALTVINEYLRCFLHILPQVFYVQVQTLLIVSALYIRIVRIINGRYFWYILCKSQMVSIAVIFFYFRPITLQIGNRMQIITDHSLFSNELFNRGPFHCPMYPIYCFDAFSFIFSLSYCC